MSPLVESITNPKINKTNYYISRNQKKSLNKSKRKKQIKKTTNLKKSRTKIVKQVTTN